MTDREVMQQALEALIDAANVLSAPMFADAADALRTALAQPEQEPVPEKEWVYGTPLLDSMTQDFVPAQRPWVGLDEDEIRELYGKDLNYRDGNYVRYAKSVEAKLKERNT